MSIFYTVHHLTFLPNFAGLNSEESSYSKTYSEFVKEFRVEPDVMVVAKSNSVEQNKAFLDALALELSKDPLIHRIYYKIDLKPFRAWALAYPPYETLKQMAGMIQQAKPLLDAIDYKIDLTQFWLTIPKISRTSTSGSANAALGLHELTQVVDLMRLKLTGKSLTHSEFEQAFQEISGIRERYITLNNGQYALLFTRPITEDKLEEMVRHIRKIFTVLAPRFPLVQAHLTGEPVLGVDEMETAKHDIFWAGIISLVLCSALFIFGFQEWRKPILSVIALFMGVGWSLGYITLSVKHLNIFTMSLFPMLIGLAIDFSIQFLGRYREELGKHGSPTEAIQVTFFSTGTGLLTAALTTSLGFFAIAFAQYRGIAELGIATGGSLLLCFLSTMTILPALLIVTEKREAIRLAQEKSLAMGSQAERFLLDRAFVVVFIAVIATSILGLETRKIRFDHNVLHLQAEGLDSIKTELELVQVAGKSSLFAVLVANDLTQAHQYINELSALDTVGNVQSPFPFLPQDQKHKLPVLRQIQQEINGLRLFASGNPVNAQSLENAMTQIDQMITDAKKKIALATGSLKLFEALVVPGSEVVPHQSMQTNFAEINHQLSLLEQSISNFLSTLRNTQPDAASRSLTQFQTALLHQLQQGVYFIKHGIPKHPVTLEDIPSSMRDQFVGKTGKIMIQVFPAQNIWERPALERFLSQLREIDPKVTGSPVLIYESTRVILESYQQAAKIAFWVILIVAFLQFRTVKLTLLTLVPLGLGLVWLMGFMVLFNKAFNPANLLTLPVILGIGVAFGVYVVNRYREENHASIFSTSTGRSVLLSALTSIAGFASLLGVSHKGLQSLGFTMTVGLSSMTLMALVVLPAFLKLMQKEGMK